MCVGEWLSDYNTNVFHSSTESTMNNSSSSYNHWQKKKRLIKRFDTKLFMVMRPGSSFWSNLIKFGGTIQAKTDSITVYGILCFYEYWAFFFSQTIMRKIHPPTAPRHPIPTHQPQGLLQLLFVIFGTHHHWWSVLILIPLCVMRCASGGINVASCLFANLYFTCLPCVCNDVDKSSLEPEPSYRNWAGRD